MRCCAGYAPSPVVLRIPNMISLKKLLALVSLATLTPATAACGRSDLLSYDGIFVDGGSTRDGSTDGSPDVRTDGQTPPNDARHDVITDGPTHDGDTGPGTGCTSSEQCPSVAKPFCELPQGVCVACLTDPDTCPPGEFCDATTHECVGLPPGGCTSSAQCPASKPVCDLKTGECVGCTNSGQCPPGEICDEEKCVDSCGGGAACGAGLDCCGIACVDEGTDRRNCGGCDIRCAKGERCVAGACQTTTSCATTGCENGATCCGDTCVNTFVSPTHCGSCDTVCAAGDTCENGKCIPPAACNGGPACTGGERCCADGCTATGSDSNNCGGCGIVCEAGAICKGGICLPSMNCNGGPACTNGDVCCAENGCTDTTSDPNNCGGCNNPCPFGDLCENSQCIPATTTCNGGPACTGVQQCCGTGCSDTQTDPANCGFCGNPCPAGDTCVQGNCQAPKSCNGGPVCTGVDQCCPTSGCVDFDNDPKNCGGCAVVCPTGDTCVGATCQVPPSCNGGPVCTGTDQCCTNGCADTTSDAANCGACGHPCPAGDTCVNSQCQAATSCNGKPACTAGQTCCPGGCLSTTSDPLNCGGCGTACAAGETCIDSTCASDEGAFNPTVNPTFLSPGVHNFTSINIPEGVTVFVAGAGAASGTLDLSSTGPVFIAGTIDVSGGPGTQNTITSQSTQAGRAGGGGFTGEPYQSAAGSAACSFVGGNGGSLGDGVQGSAGSCTVASTTTCIDQNDPTALVFTSPVATFGGGGGVFTGFRAYGAGGGGPAGGAPGALGAAFAGENDCSGVSGGGGAVNGAGGAGTGAYKGGAGMTGQTQCAGLDPGVSAAFVGGGGGGSIGAAAIADLKVASTFQTGSAGGGGSADYLDRPVFGGTSGGGGGGGALKIASTTSISITGQVLANGGAGGDAVIGIGSDANCDPQPGAAGGGGSGGVIYLSAPTISVSSAASVSAAGGAGGVGSEFATGGAGGNGGLGRIRLSVGASSCATLSGSFTPALPAGCTAAPAKAGVAFIGTFPN